MKHYKFFKVSLQIAFTIVLSSLIYSCLNSKKEEALIALPTDMNEAKIEDMRKEADAQFLVNATQISLEQIKLGKLAQQLGSSKTIRDLGKMTQTEHTQSLTEVTELAKSKTVTIPTTLTFDGEAAYNALNTKSSKDFDKTYSDMMVNGHQNAIALFEKTCNESNDTDIREWATKTLPTLKMHLAQAEQAQKEANKE